MTELTVDEITEALNHAIRERNLDFRADFKEDYVGCGVILYGDWIPEGKIDQEGHLYGVALWRYEEEGFFADFGDMLLSATPTRGLDIWDTVVYDNEDELRSQFEKGGLIGSEPHVLVTPFKNIADTVQPILDTISS